ncbi:hypothetical protein BVRB_5g118250 isoform B [Beta vulgaris subsp. vulgaris]|nr:hypothetical protein BVRB_5g118250 isoform B [Beta vulgaris subsp. vulgaris]
MRGDASSEQEQDDPDVEFVEVDPTGRYGRYKEVLGKGAFKKVYRAFDELEGLEVAWNQVKVSELLRNSEDLERLYSEVHLLQTLKHKNIIKFYNSWVDTKNEHINFITEIFTSGTLRQYRKKHKRVDLRALKKWSKQILEGLLYLHSHDPPVIHRDLKCDNIFVNGNHGELKIGDLGLAAILHHANAAHSVIGTPEFMAPELYEEEYNELVDIYAFGMCLLELVTFEYPYTECSNAAQIYKKVTTGIKPACLMKVTDPDVKAFVEKCITKVEDRLSAKELLRHPFLSDVSPEIAGHSSQVNLLRGESSSEAVHKKSGTDKTTFLSDVSPEIAGHSSQVNLLRGESSSEAVHKKSDTDKTSVLDNSDPGPSRGLSVHGERKDINTIFIKLRIADSKDKCRNIHFPFDIEADTSIAVASEMVHELDLTDQDITNIADMIDSEIRALIPEWSPKDSSGGDSPFNSQTSDFKEDSSPPHAFENKDDVSPLTSASPFSTSSFFPDQLPSGRKFWSDSPKTGVGAGLSPVKCSPLSPSEGRSEMSPQNPGITNWREPKKYKDEDYCGVLPPIRPSIFHLESGADSNYQEKDLLESPRNFVLHEEKIDEVPLEPATTENYLTEDKARCQEEVCYGQSDAITLSPGLNGERDNGDLEKRGAMDRLGKNDGESYAESDLRILAENLDQLLAQQQKELDELKLKHKLVISQVLEDIPPHMRLKVLKMCSRKIPDYKLHSKMKSHVPNFPGYNGADNCSQVPGKRIFTRSLSTIDLCSPRPNTSKQDATSEMGIAVILKDDSEEL